MVMDSASCRTASRLSLNLQFSTQGIAGQVVEFVGQNWKDVGINTQVKEVTPDEYPFRSVC